MKCEDVVIPFGKHKGETLRDVLRDDPTYLDWLAGEDIRSPALAAAVKEMCDKYASEIERAIGD